MKSKRRQQLEARYGTILTERGMKLRLPRRRPAIRTRHVDYSATPARTPYHDVQAARIRSLAWELRGLVAIYAA